jgi:hypothetical protein
MADEFEPVPGRPPKAVEPAVAPWDAPDPTMPWDRPEPQQPSIPRAVFDRVKRGLEASRVYNAAHDIMKGSLKSGIAALDVETPLGFDRFPESRKWFLDNGLIKSPEEQIEGTSGLVGGLRSTADATIRTAAQGIDLINRLSVAPLHGLGGGVGGLAVALGLVKEGSDDQKSLTAQANEFFEVAALFAGSPEASGSFTVTRFGPRGEVIEKAISPLPKDVDFKYASHYLTDGTNAPHVEAKLRELYEDHGILPAEAAWDAGADPIIKQALVSVGTDLPDFYTLKGSRDGAGGKPPPPPKDPAGAPREAPEPGSYEAARDDVLSRLSIGENPKLEPGSWIDEQYTNFVDKLYPIQSAVEASGLKLTTADNPYRLARLFSGVGGKVDVMLNHETFNFFTHAKTGESLRDILAPIRGQLNDFRAFAVSARAIELERRGIKTGINLESAKRVGQERTKQFEQTMTKLVDYQQRVAEYARDAGLISRKGFEEMVRNNRMYVPFHALMDVDGRGIPGISAANLRTKQPFKKIKGSERLKIDPLESIIKNTYALVANADRNVISTKLVDTLLKAQPKELGRAPGTSLIEIRPEPRDLDLAINESIREAQGETLGSMGKHAAPSELLDLVKDNWIEQKPGEISIFRDGRRMTYLIDPDLAAAFSALDKPTMGVLSEMFLNPLASTLRAGAVLSPEFLVRHNLRDFAYAHATYKGQGTFSPVDMARGFTAMIMGTFKGRNGGELGSRYVDWMRDGGGHVSMVAIDRNYLQENLRKLTDDTGLMSRAWNAVKANPLQGTLHPLSVANEIVTSASHLGAYIKRMRELEKDRAKGMPPGPAEGSAAIKLGRTRAPGQLVPVDAPQNLPAHLKGDLVLRDGMSFSEARKAADRHTIDGQWSELTVAEQQSKRDALEAAWVSRETAVDVMRSGAITSSWNSMSAFFNTKVQDATVLASGLKNDFVNTSIKFGTAITVPSVLLWFATTDNERVQDRPRWEKDMFWIIPTDNWVDSTADEIEARLKTGQTKKGEVRLSNGQWQRNDQILIRYPKPFSAGMIFGTLPERMLDQFYAEKPDAFKGFIPSMFEQSAGNLMPSATVPMWEQSTNKSMMTGRNIVPAPLEGGLPEYEYTPYTTELAKAIGRNLAAIPGVRDMSLSKGGGFTAGVASGAARAMTSPAMIENYVRGWTGPLGMTIFTALDKAGVAVGLLPKQDHAPSGLSDIPVVRAFVARHPGSSQAVQDFYDNHSSMEPYRKTFDRLLKQGDMVGMQRIMDIGGPEMFVKLDGIKTSLGLQYEAIRRVDSAPEKQIPKAQKRQIIDSLFFGMVRTAQLGNEITRQIEKGLK